LCAVLFETCVELLMWQSKYASFALRMIENTQNEGRSTSRIRNQKSQTTISRWC